MTDDITQRLRVTMPVFKGLEISCPCRSRSSLMKEAADEVEKLRAEKEALYVSIVGIERAAAGAIYSQESIHAMALYALKSLEAKP